MKKVLIVCTGNTCRSPMAQAMLTQMVQDKELRVEVESAGVSAFGGDAPTPQAEQAMKGYGLDISTHRSRAVHVDMLAECDLILTMTSSHKQQILRVLPDMADKIFVLGEYAKYLEQENQTVIQNSTLIDQKSNMNPDVDTSKWDVSDPYGQLVDSYIKTAREIKGLLAAIVRYWELNGGV